LSPLSAYASETGDEMIWPLTESAIAGFSSWADLTRRLSAATIRSYISSFSQTQVLTRMPPIHLAAFFGSMRIGELFPPGEPLVWDDVSIGPDCVLFRLRTPKVRSTRGDVVSLFRFPQPGLCPVAAMEEVRRAATEAGTGGGRDCVFTSPGSGPWRHSDLDSRLRGLLGKVDILSPGESVTGHSFRARVPSALATLGTPAALRVLLSWGRWRSSAFAAYTRFHLSERRASFDFIVDALLGRH